MRSRAGGFRGTVSFASGDVGAPNGLPQHDVVDVVTGAPCFDWIRVDAAVGRGCVD